MALSVRDYVAYGIILVQPTVVSCFSCAWTGSRGGLPVPTKAASFSIRCSAFVGIQGAQIGNGIGLAVDMLSPLDTSVVGEHSEKLPLCVSPPSPTTT